MKKELDKVLAVIEDFLESQTDKKGKVDAVNKIRKCVHQHSPFKNEPVDFVEWVENTDVCANDYNPNKVAPPEMKLLELSIFNDGYTQPIVAWDSCEKNSVEVIDGFHRHKVGKDSDIIRDRVMGYLPVVKIRKAQSGKNDRIASTIRHNRARGKHQVDAMSEIVIELKNRNWSNSRISKQLGMDEEEVLRLCQISGLEHLFNDSDFSSAWESSDSDDIEYEVITDDVDNEMDMYRIPLEKEKGRIYHTYDKWECHKAGFYLSKHPSKNDDECKELFVKVLTDLDLFKKCLNRVLSEWKYSCEHYLTNKAMNRLAWLGQAAACIEYGVPSVYSSEWETLTDYQKNEANKIALEFLNKWLDLNNFDKVDEDLAVSIKRQVELY